MKKKYTGILAISLAVLFAVGLLAAAGRVTPEEQEILLGQKMEYEENFFDNSMVHTIDIQVSEEDWAHMKAEAMSKECIGGTVVIDGQTMYNVGVRPKGNSTLFFNAAKGWDRVSLVLEFDAFQESQRFQGLDCLALYNNLFDATTMKSWLSYEMMRSMDVNTPLCSFAALHLNGEFIGMYSASEMFTESFAVRNFGYDYGNIYKPEHMDIGPIMTGELRNTKINFSAFTAKSEDGGSGFTIDSILTSSNDAVRLAYLGESLYDYEDIWRNTSFPIGVSDKERFVEAIRRINEKDRAEEVVDMDQLARYFAVNTFVLNSDCYTTGMAHNYGIYEKDGVVTMLPWDYDVGLGNIAKEFGITSATEFINQPIDEPVMGTTMEERPMLQLLMESEAGKALYYEYLDQLTAMWIESGMLEEQVTAMEALVRPWVEKEQTELQIYSLEEHDQALESMLKFAAYRGESVRGQLEGTIPKTAAGQAAAPETLVDCSDYNPPDSGIMKVLMPHADANEVTVDALLQVLPEVCENMKHSVSMMVLLSMVDYGSVFDMLEARAAEAGTVEVSAGDGSDVSAETPEEDEGHDVDVKEIIKIFLPYTIPFIADTLMILAIPAATVLGIVFVRRWRKKGGVKRVL